MIDADAKPLKICIFTETYYPVVGGGETQAQLLADSLIARGQSVILLTRRSDRDLKKYERVGSVPVYRIHPVGGGQLKKWGLVFSAIPALLKLRNQFDLVFVSGYRIVGISAVILCKILRKKCILKADSQGEMSGDFFNAGLRKFRLSHRFLPFKFFLGFRNYTLKKADAFVALSGELANELEAFGVPDRKINRIPNSVDVARFHPVTREQKQFLRQKLSLPDNCTIVIYTGRLVTYKGLPLLVKVWKELSKKHSDIKLLLVGGGGLDIHNCEQELKSFVKAHQLSGSVLFTGDIRNVHEYLQASDIFVFPTENETFGSSLIEAMACQLPVITTPVGAINEIVTDRQNGLVIQTGNSHLLFQALDLLIQEEQLRHQLGRSAQMTVDKHYTSDVVTERYMALFTEYLT
jgi:glycosyltransferase involved in cell wall biosynthesis